MILRFWFWWRIASILIIVAFVIFGFCSRLAHAHILDVEHRNKEVIELEHKTDKIERDREGNRACERVKDGTASDRDIERSVEHIRETTH